MRTRNGELINGFAVYIDTYIDTIYGCKKPEMAKLLIEIRIFGATKMLRLDNAQLNEADSVVKAEMTIRTVI